MDSSLFFLFDLIAPPLLIVALVLMVATLAADTGRYRAELAADHPKTKDPARKGRRRRRRAREAAGR